MRIRATASVALAAVVLLSTAGCNFLAPQATTESYDPSNGVSAQLDDVKILNALIISDDGETGALSTNIVNQGDSETSVLFQYETASGPVDEVVTVAAGEVAEIGGPTGIDIVLHNMDSIPGDMFWVYMQQGSATGKMVEVPVMTGELPEYAPLVPTPSPSAKPQS